MCGSSTPQITILCQMDEALLSIFKLDVVQILFIPYMDAKTVSMLPRTVTISNLHFFLHLWSGVWQWGRTVFWNEHLFELPGCFKLLVIFFYIIFTNSTSFKSASLLFSIWKFQLVTETPYFFFHLLSLAHLDVILLVSWLRFHETLSEYRSNFTKLAHCPSSFIFSICLSI